jgi:autotransporter-associated beta strand protein
VNLARTTAVLVVSNTANSYTGGTTLVQSAVLQVGNASALGSGVAQLRGRHPAAG